MAITKQFPTAFVFWRGIPVTIPDRTRGWMLLQQEAFHREGGRVRHSQGPLSLRAVQQIYAA